MITRLQIHNAPHIQGLPRNRHGAPIRREPCQLCGAPTVPSLAGGYCVDCVEDDGKVTFSAGRWRATPAARARRTMQLLGNLAYELVYALPLAIRDDWREHRAIVAARQAAEKGFSDCA